MRRIEGDQLKAVGWVWKRAEVQQGVRFNAKGARAVFTVGAVGDGEHFTAPVAEDRARVGFVQPHHAAAAAWVENAGIRCVHGVVLSGVSAR